MPRFFNVAGPCHPGKHYLLPSLTRVPELDQLLERGQYFVLHAARQTGKTTFLLALAKELEASGRYRAI